MCNNSIPTVQSIQNLDRYLNNGDAYNLQNISKIIKKEALEVEKLQVYKNGSEK